MAGAAGHPRACWAWLVQAHSARGASDHRDLPGIRDALADLALIARGQLRRQQTVWTEVEDRGGRPSPRGLDQATGPEGSNSLPTLAPTVIVVYIRGVSLARAPCSLASSL